jgi:hypothetical protein
MITDTQAKFASRVIFNSQQYEKLIGILVKHISPDGKAFAFEEFGRKAFEFMLSEESKRSKSGIND